MDGLLLHAAERACRSSCTLGSSAAARWCCSATSRCGLFLGDHRARRRGLFLWLCRAWTCAVLEAAREATFNVVSIISTTGFTSQDFDQWGDFPPLVLLVCMLVGGCTGSTAGGIKMFRLVILLARCPRPDPPPDLSARRLRRDLQQAAASPTRSAPASASTSSSTCRRSSPSPWRSPSAACRSRKASAPRRRRWAASAPASAALIGPCCTFAPLPDAAKWLLTDRDAGRPAGNPRPGRPAHPHLLADVRLAGGE